jgi:hypothetical protein
MAKERSCNAVGALQAAGRPHLLGKEAGAGERANFEAGATEAPHARRKFEQGSLDFPVRFPARVASEVPSKPIPPATWFGRPATLRRAIDG